MLFRFFGTAFFFYIHSMKLHLLIFTLLAVAFCNAQNLVVNGSFEEYTNCPYAYSQIYFCTGWTSTQITCDYYNVCAPSIQEIGGPYPASMSVPQNVFGYQQAYDGHAYCGFLGLEENFEGSLMVPLTIGAKYFVSFRVSFAFNANESVSAVLATNKIGLLFTDVQHPNEIQGQVPYPNYAHVYTDDIISDTSNWVVISGAFIADSAYRYIMVGQLFDGEKETLSLIPTPPSYALSYYYVDAICVSSDSAFVAGGCGYTQNTDTTVLYPIDTTHINIFAMPTAFTPNGDNVNDIYQPVPANTNVTVFRIYNRWGEKIYEARGTNVGWDGKYKGEPQPPDVYTYYIEVKTAKGKTESKTGSFTLLR